MSQDEKALNHMDRGRSQDAAVKDHEARGGVGSNTQDSSASQEEQSMGSRGHGQGDRALYSLEAEDLSPGISPQL